MQFRKQDARRVEGEVERKDDEVSRLSAEGLDQGIDPRPPEVKCSPSSEPRPGTPRMWLLVPGGWGRPLGREVWGSCTAGKGHRLRRDHRGTCNRPLCNGRLRVVEAIVASPCPPRNAWLHWEAGRSAPLPPMKVQPDAKKVAPTVGSVATKAVRGMAADEVAVIGEDSGQVRHGEGGRRAEVSIAHVAAGQDECSGRGVDLPQATILEDDLCGLSPDGAGHSNVAALWVGGELQTANQRRRCTLDEDFAGGDEDLGAFLGDEGDPDAHDGKGGIPTRSNDQGITGRRLVQCVLYLGEVTSRAIVAIDDPDCGCGLLGQGKAKGECERQAGRTQPHGRVSVEARVRSVRSGGMRQRP